MLRVTSVRGQGVGAGQAGRPSGDRLAGSFRPAGHSLAALALAVARDGSERLARADRAVMAALPAWRTPSGIAAARAVSAAAEPAVTGPVLAAATVIAARGRGWRAAALPALAVPAGVAARWLLSEMIARPRPPAAIWLSKPEGYSLPSRHTAVAALTAGAVAASVGATGLRRRAIPLLAATGVGASRVYLGVHWPSDVLAGWVFAAAWLGLAERTVGGAAPGPSWCPPASPPESGPAPQSGDRVGFARCRQLARR